MHLIHICSYLYITFIKCTSSRHLCLKQNGLPAITPEVSVATTGLCRALMLLRGLKSSPSLAMANNTRGIGNMAPSRLSNS